MSELDGNPVPLNLRDGSYHGVFDLYRTLFTAEGPDETSAKVRIAPFEEVEIDLGMVFGPVP